MKPLGRKKFKLPSKKDFHPPKGFMNWWEDVCTPNKKAELRMAMKEAWTEAGDY